MTRYDARLDALQRRLAAMSSLGDAQAGRVFADAILRDPALCHAACELFRILHAADAIGERLGLGEDGASSSTVAAY